MIHLPQPGRRSLLILVLCSLLLPGLSSLGRAESLVSIVATIPPLADIARQVGGELVAVESLLPPGASPHTFEPRPAQVRSLGAAGLLFGVGAGLDDWALRLAAGSRAEVLLAAEAAEKAGFGLEFGEGREHEHEHDQGHGGIDPHVWLDPIAVRDAVAPALAEALIELLPGSEPAIRANLEAFQRRLDELDRDVRAMLEPLPSRAFIAYHSAWAYFARRYGLEELASVAAFPGQEPSARWIATVVDAARRHGVRVIFAEPQLSPKAAQVIASEIGGAVLLLDPLGGVEGRFGYIDLIEYNARMLAEAFGALRTGEAQQ